MFRIGSKSFLINFRTSCRTVIVDGSFLSLRYTDNVRSVCKHRRSLQKLIRQALSHIWDYFAYLTIQWERVSEYAHFQITEGEYCQLDFLWKNFTAFFPVALQSASNIFLDSMQTLQSCQQMKGVLGGVILYHNKLELTQIFGLSAIINIFLQGRRYSTVARHNQKSSPHWSLSNQNDRRKYHCRFSHSNRCAIDRCFHSNQRVSKAKLSLTASSIDNKSERQLGCTVSI